MHFLDWKAPDPEIAGCPQGLLMRDRGLIMTQPEDPRPAMSEEQISQILKRMASGFRDQIRSPILSTPADQGLAFENVTFPSEDGVPLEAWFIPRPGSDKLIIANHPRWFNRYGLPSHLEPWKSLGAMAGNDFEVNFIPDYKILHDSGYNVLTYDLRNHGHSGSGNGGLVSSGRYESRDVIGSLQYARSRRNLSGMTIGLFSRCLGCNSTMFAMSRAPDQFRDVRCMVGVQPLAVPGLMKRVIGLIGIPADRIDQLDQEIRLVTSFRLGDLSPADAAKDFRVPSFIYQVREDVMSEAADVRTIFDNIGTEEKGLFWIDGTTRRWDGYTYFSRHPEKMLAWFEKYMA
jgi:pimeloyl-ACP methyl ester carboxylesterase